MKFFVVTKNKLGYGCLLAVLIAALLSVHYDFVSTVVTSVAGTSPMPIYSVNRYDNKIAFSFDVAAGNEGTHTVLDALDRCGVKTTFFVTGDWVREHPDLVRTMHEKGHEVMNHSDTHPHLTKLSDSEIVSQAAACGDTIEQITGIRPTLFRVPYGEYDKRVIETLQGQNLQVIQWGIDSLDWKDFDSDHILKRVEKNLCPGAVLLFHSEAKFTAEAVASVAQLARDKNLEIVPVSQLVYTENYTIDSRGCQYPDTIPSNTLE